MDGVTRSPSTHAENQAFDLRDGALRRREFRGAKPSELPVPVGLAQPRGHRVSVVLVGAAPIHGIGVFPKGRVDLHHSRAACQDLPAVKRPEMHPLAQLPAQVQQPRYPGMRGLGDLARHIEVKHRLGRAGPFLRLAAPAGIAGAIGAFAVQTVADEIDRHIVFIGRPVPLKIF